MAESEEELKSLLIKVKEESEKVALKLNIQFSSVAQLCLTFCDHMNCSTPGFPVHHQLPELTQTHVHQVGDATQPSHPLGYSVQFSSVAQSCPTLQPHESQHARLPCPSPTPGVQSNSRPSSQ